MKRFAYLFTLGGKIVVSRENEVQLRHRVKSEPKEIRDKVANFIKTSFPGDDMQLPSGEFIFCVAGW
jgi:hypothetical protein